MRSSLLAVAALAILRIVLGLHFFLEGMSHLHDPSWSSAGFRRAAVGPLADTYRADLPQTGDWSGTLGAVGGGDTATVAAAWKQTVVDGWRRELARRQQVAPLDAAAQTDAEKRLVDAEAMLDDAIDGWGEDLVDYRLQVERLAATQRSPASSEIPYARERVSKKQKELSGKSARWMGDAAAIGKKLQADWDGLIAPAGRAKLAASAEPPRLWKADRFVSWSLVTIGACLVLGFLVKFNAMGGVVFLATILAAQPFWVAGAQPTYNQWVEATALLAIACLPTGGWSGLDYFLKSCFLKSRLGGCCGRKPDEVRG
ncbi:MAG: hypothetical protein DWH79_08245 [Planctomycetota bacterium]|nr:MAG: hypothetical protein DWH79_08245 [Planctomycetota bacterium]